MLSRTARGAVLLVVFLATVVGVAGYAAPPAGAAYPGRDGRIAFVRGGQIYTMTPWGNDVTRLTTAGRNYRPRWSPDGRRISYIHAVDGRRDVWVMNARGRHKRAVTRSGDVTSAGASWSPDGRRLAFAAPELKTIRSTAPFRSPRTMTGVPTGGRCDGDGDGTSGPVYVDRFVAWSPDGTRIAVLDHSDCFFDDRIDWYHPATEELRQYAASGGDCCGYLDWTNLFWGPDGQFGYSERDLGQYGDQDAPSRIVYPGFRSRDGDTSGAPSPSGAFLALTNASSGKARIIRARADGTCRRVLTTGYQPDWQPRP